MRKFRKSFRYGEKGFTLIELLIVIAILGVLAAVVIPNVARFTQSGHKAAAMQEMETVQTAADAAMADAGLVGVDGGTVGPGTPGVTTFDVNATTGPSVYVGEFLRRDLDGSWVVGTTGLVTSGKYKDAATSGFWTYTESASPQWSWTP